MKTARRSRPARLLRTAGTAIAAVLLGAAGSPASAGLKRSEGGPRPVAPNRARFVRDRTAAMQLGNALFWATTMSPQRPL